MDRSTLATAQVLPALSRKTAVVTPDISADDAARARCMRAAELTRQSFPMYEGYYTFAQLYAGNIGILTARESEPGE